MLRLLTKIILGAADDDGIPEVRANALPRFVTRGNLLQIQALFLDRESQRPQKVGTIYLTIRDQTGREVYPVSAVARNQSGMVIDIGTGEFPPGQYNLMVSPSRALSPSDTASFTVTGPPLPEPAPILQKIDKQKTAVPSDPNLKKKVNEFVENVPIVPLLAEGRGEALFQSKIRFVTELDHKVCPICQAYDGEVFEQDDVRKPDIPIHPNCLLPDTICEAPGGIISGLRARYDGPVIELVKADGGRLTITPNHNLLTPQGWISADLLREGDQIIQKGRTYGINSIDPNIDGQPTKIKEIFIALQKTAGMTTVSMPLAPEYLHSDAKLCKGQIDIVGADPLLWNYNNSGRLQQAKQLTLVAGHPAGPFNTYSPLTQKIKTLVLASDSIMGGLRQPAAVFGRRLRHTQIHGSASTPLDNPPAIQHGNDPAPTNTELLSKLLDRSAGIIERQNLVKVNVRRWAGHVYDLQTWTSAYIANAIIISNCRCHYEYVDQEPSSPKITLAEAEQRATRFRNR